VPFVSSTSASTASRPAFVTIAIAPLWDETAALMDLIWGNREQIYFCKWEWTGQIRLIRLNKSVFCENCPGAILVRLTL
jgi:hypothetical protein